MGIIELYGQGLTKTGNSSLINSVKGILSQGFTKGASNSYLFKTIDTEVWSDPNLIVCFKPYIGGGGVLTYKVGTPNIATFWDIVGVGMYGFEEAPHGSLRFHYVKSDMAGLAVNAYISSKNPAHAGHRDRIIVRKVDA